MLRFSVTDERVQTPLGRSPCKRRGFLARLLVLVAGGVSLALPSSAATRDTPALPGDVLPEAERRIAALGERFASDEPEAALQLVAWVESQLPAWAWLAAPARKARVSRERLLVAERLAEEIERAEVLMVDGLMLARSEVGLAVYLHSLARRAASAG